MHIHHWTRWGGHTSEEREARPVAFERLTREYVCEDCGGALVQYPPDRHGEDQWHVACARCGNSSDFIHVYELKRQRREAEQLLEHLPEELAELYR